MVDRQLQEDAALVFALPLTSLPFAVKPAPTLRALFRRANRWSPASHQAIPKTTAKTVTKANAVRMADGIISRTLVGCVTAGREL
ncbi:MAG: hypothetical protein E5V62_19030 [Mesorhizobium sp.]|uniref:hypothetical protein n=1 Tax=Mesorhizobium sp. TaxID=1871066 RepID=UPI000FD6001D|nr:hypothetical protein [Mesorhizobium sp.]RVD72928.1 hypothetical protein EN751_07535 [Mesorhizobium sp. M4A.F.Ca.ET.029.04.2.1]TIW33765.1 MAG: hypothetical protein E5V62_19030 [Mesorhizobium sp.]